MPERDVGKPKRARIVFDITPEMKSHLEEAAAENNMSVAKFVTKALQLQILIDKLSTRGLSAGIRDENGQVVNTLPFSLLPALSEMDERLLDHFLKPHTTS